MVKIITDKFCQNYLNGEYYYFWTNLLDKVSQKQ